MKDNDKEGAKKKSLTQKIKESCAMQSARGDTLEVCGRESMLVRGCRKILLYSTEEIRLLLHSYILTVRGRDLYCTSYFSDAVSIDGHISSLEMSEKEKK